MNRYLLLAALVAASFGTPPARAQTANASPASGAGGGGGNVSRTAPSGSTAIPNPGAPQMGDPTPLERHEERKMQKDTGSVCKGC